MTHFTASAALLLVAIHLPAVDAWDHVTVESEPQLAGDEVQFIQEGPRERIWIGTMGGLTSYADGAFARFANADGKPLEGAVWSLAAGVEADLAIATNNGVVHVADGRFRRELAGNSTNPLVPFGDGALWAIAKDASESNTLVQSQGGAWSPVEGFADRKVVDLFLAEDGAVWVVVDGNGVVRVDPASPEREEAHLAGLNIQSLYQDRDGRVWAGRWGRGVLVFEDGSWSELLTDEESAVIHIAQTTDGSMWFGTTASGLWQFADGAWTQHLHEDGPISVLEATSDGRVWVSSQATRGLKYWSGSEWVLSLDSPMPVRCLVETSEGLWAGGVLDGLHILRKGE